MRHFRAFMLALLLLCLPSSWSIANAKGVLTVAFLDVGQGDAIYIEAPNGNQMLIDGGPPGSLLLPLSDVMPFGDRSINVLMVTNPDADHYAGFVDLIGTYDVGAVVVPGTKTKTSTYAKLQKEIADEKIPELLARKGMKIALDTESGVYFEVLVPDRDVSSWTTNDGSIQGLLTYGKTKVMFTGDGTKRTEGIVVSENSRDVLKSDILKIGHHGSRTSTSDALMKAVNPRYAVISDGKENKYGHPHKETLDTLMKNNVQVLRTDQQGTIVFISNGAVFSYVK